MTHSRDTRKHPGIKRSFLPLPANLEGTQSYCITIPDGLDNKKVLIDLLVMATYWFNWDRSEGTLGKQTADAWRDTLNLPELQMCCCPEPTNRRYNEDGQLEVSYDGGVTWTLAPQLDDRFSGIVAPPISGADGAEKRCAAAASAEEYVKQNFIEELNEGSAYADIYAAAVAVIALLGVTGIGLLIAAAAAAIFLAGVTAIQAAFTTEVWVDFRCILYCHISEDGSFTPATWEQVKSDILLQFTGAVSAVLYNWVNSVGPVGLTNAARSGFVVSADCSACECPNCSDNAYAGIDVTDFDHGSIVSRNPDGTITCELQPSGAAAGYLILRFDTLGDCCYINSFTQDSGASAGAAFIPCGTPYGEGNYILATPVGQCAQYAQWQGDAGAIITITMSECP